MKNHQFTYYECENSNCGLRFPGYDGYPKWNRCPVCRSNIHIVARADITLKNINHSIFHKKLLVVALLDNIRSAWNVGSIFRTSDGTGVSQIYLCGISPTPENPKVSKTALGAEKNIHWEHSKNGVRKTLELKSMGYKIWVFEDMPNAIPLFHVELPTDKNQLVLVLGNEVTGVDPGIIDICDKIISIPMIGEKSSYNVATAFGIAASFLLYRQSFSQGSNNILPRT